LDDDRRDFFWGCGLLEQTIFNPVECALRNSGITAYIRAEGIAILVWERDVDDVEHLSLESTTLRDFRIRECQRSKGATVKAAEERNEFFPTRRVHRQLQSSLDGLCAAVTKVRARRPVDGNDLVELLREVAHALIKIVGAADVDQSLSLL